MSTYPLTIEEACSCGATVRINGGEIYAKYAAIAWRADHHHEPGNHAAMLDRLEAQVYGDGGFISRMVDAEAAASEARAALLASNRRSVELGDAGDVEGSQNGAERCAECIDLSPGLHYPGCKHRADDLGAGRQDGDA